MSVRDVASLPFFAGVGGVVLLLGTVVGQNGHGDVGGANDPMMGMNMGSGGGGSSSTSSSMPGMNMGSGNAFSGTNPASSSSMPGMNMGSGSGSGGAGMKMPDGSTMSSAAMPTNTGAGGATMKMPDGSSMPSAAMPMNMTDPQMAAQMPGGLHSTCAGDTCTVIFADKATGVAKILGTTAKLDSAKAKQIVLTVGKKKLTLRQGKPVTDGKLRIELTASNAGEYTVKFTKSH
jgi:hypothetical protein